MNTSLPSKKNQSDLESGALGDLVSTVKGTVLPNEPLSRHTSYGIGGPALAFIWPLDTDDLKTVLTQARTSNVPVFFIGSGSNLLVSDEGFPGIVISLVKHFKTMRIDGTRVYAQTGTMMGHFVKECFKHNLAGVESLIGVPGTLGGAIRMNAGAYGREISNSLISLDVMTLDGEEKSYRKQDLSFDYRSSSLEENEVVLAGHFEFKKGNSREIQVLRDRASRSRKTTQPLRFRSAGSVFKNPSAETAAGYLIDKAGLKGSHRGDAEISPKHANFFINHGKASSEDVVWLIRLARKTVSEKFGVDLDLEIRTLGFPEGYLDP
ncbi:MAG: UDP-N-acetylmuramate dehydrogenase [Fidelibacterota bacterium]